MKLGRHEIEPDRTFIIAEAGTNFAGWTPEFSACIYVTEAARVGADAIKFQMFVPGEPLFCPADGDGKRWERWGATIISYQSWAVIKRECESQGLVFLASAFQPTAVQWLKELGVEAYKVASRARNTYPYDSVPGPFIVSAEWPHTMHIMKQSGYLALQCRPIYPAPWDRSSLLQSFGNEDGDVFLDASGLSDHTGNIWAGLHAITHGASMLEVHFSIHDDKRDAGPDVPVCLTTAQLKFLCEARDAFAALRQA